MTLILVVATMAGCAEAPTDAPSPEPVLEGPHCNVRGVVVDDAIVPVDGVNITAQPGDHHAISDATGGYCLPLGNGTYTVTATKDGYVTVTLTLAVDDAAAPPAPRIQLQRDVQQEPFVVETKFDGLLACSIRLPTGGFNDGCGAFGDDGLGSTQRHQIEFAEGALDWVQTELIWSPNSPFSQTLCTRGKEADLYPVGDVCAGPNLVRFLDDAQVTADAIDRGQWFEYIVFPDHIVPVGGDVDGTGGAVMQQDFQLFVHGFYNRQPIDGWSFGAHGPP